MPDTPGDETRGRVEAFSLVRGVRLFRVQRVLGLIPRDGGLGVGRRAVLLALLAWLPVVVWAAMTGRALPGRVSEPLFEHFGVHVRCLVAIPLFIVAEATVHAMSMQLVPYFVARRRGRRSRATAAPELGPVADTLTLYESVARMRTVPVGRMALASVLVPAVLAMLAVVVIRVPVKDLVLPILKTLV
jgi:hypothetical protein